MNVLIKQFTVCDKIFDAGSMSAPLFVVIALGFAIAVTWWKNKNKPARLKHVTSTEKLSMSTHGLSRLPAWTRRVLC